MINPQLSKLHKVMIRKSASLDHPLNIFITPLGETRDSI